MRKEQIRELDEHIHLTTFQPKALAHEAATGGPLVSIYVPIKRTECEGRRDEWDRTEFKDLCEEAYRTLEQTHEPKEFQGIKQKLDYLLSHEDLPLWIDGSKGLAFLVTDQDAFVINMNTAPKPSVVVGPQFCLKPLLRDAMFEMSYKLLLLNTDFFALLDGDYNGVHYLELPQNVKDHFAETYPEFDGETTALDYYSLEDHESPYRDHKSRKEVTQDEAEKFFHYVNKAMTDTLVHDCPDPVILVTVPEHEHLFRKICTFKTLMPECIRKDARTLSGTDLRDAAVALIEAHRAEGLSHLNEEYGYKASQGQASDDICAISEALVERKVDVLMLEAGKGIPGTFDTTSGTVTFNGAKDPADDEQLDPSSPDIANAFAQAALMQDAKVIVLPTDQMPTKTGIAATYRF